MVDIVSPQVRSRMMAGIRSAGTKPEIQLGRALHASGLRYRRNVRTLPGKPDLVFAQHRAAVFVNGCFWHGHDCHLFKWPSSRPEFWRNKIEGNRIRDARVESELHNLGWRIARVWECALKGKSRLLMENVSGRCVDWIRGNENFLEIRGL